MVGHTRKSRPKCANHKLYKTPRGDYMADMGDGRIAPVIKTGVNEYEEGENNA